MELLSLDMHDITRCQNQKRREFMAHFSLEGLHAKYIEALCEKPGISQEMLCPPAQYAGKERLGTPDAE